MSLKDIEDIYPVSPLQRAILEQKTPGPESASFCRLLECRLLGRPDLSALELAFHRSLERHAMLRTAFVWKRLADPVQAVHRQVPFSLTVVDLSGLSRQEAAEDLGALVKEERSTGIDPLKPPLIRVVLCKTGDEETHLIATFHSLVADERSILQLLTEVFELYRSFHQGSEPQLDSRDTFWSYLDSLDSRNVDGADVFWKDSLRGIHAPTSITIDQSPTRASDAKPLRLAETMKFSPSTIEALESFAKAHGPTPGTVLHGAWALLLSRYSGDCNLIYGALFAGCPPSPELRGPAALGPMANVVPVRIRVSGGLSVSSWLRSVETWISDAARFDFTPLRQIRRASDFPGELPLFESVVSAECPRSGCFEGTFANIEVVDVRVSSPDPAPILIRSSAGGLTIEYDATRFEAGAIRRTLAHLNVLVAGMVHSPNERIGSLKLVSGDEARLLSEWSSTVAEYPRAPESIHREFEEQVRNAPDRIALTCAGVEMSYGELNRRANQLAHSLIDLGVGLDDRVGICLRRSVEMIVGLLGILKAGAAYVPVDSSQPEQRGAFMLADSAVKFVFVQEGDQWAVPDGVHRVCLDRDWHHISKEEEQNPLAQVGGENLAYVMYTSGSTGQPKGVLIPHRGVIRLVKGASYADFGADRIFLQLATLSFDASTFEIWGPLLNGARLVIMPPGYSTLDDIGGEVLAQRVSTLWLTAALFDEMVDHQLESLRDVRELLAGGDVLSQSHVKRYLLEHQTGALINGYGPTENTTFTCTFRVTSSAQIKSSVPIGGPVTNTRVHIVDGEMHLQPIGLPGELMAGGDGLARGYLNRADLTAEKFIPDPHGHRPGGRLYRTGDLAFYGAEGDLEFIGRRDKQVKIRGFRIELQEIEESLKAQAGIRQAVVLVREETGDKRLVAYLVWDGDPRIPIAVLKTRLAAALPDYMVPGVYVELDAIPITPNGKVDRAALPAPAQTRLELKDPALPRDATELRVVQIWQEILGVQAAGIQESFFDLGGHSLLAARLMAKVEREFGVRLPLSALFEQPTVAALAGLIRKKGEIESRSMVVPIQPRGLLQPFFCVHPAGGNVLCYAQLARHLGCDRPFYGVQAQGLSGTEAPHQKIEAMASDYIESVREIQADGPYLLGGWSMGGVVAFEMARQLEERGQQVDALVLIDSRNPRLDADLLQMNGFNFESFAYHIGLPFDHRLNNEFLLSLDDPLAFLLEQARSASALPLDVDLRQIRRLFDVFSANVEALRCYVPRPRAARMTLLRAGKQKRGLVWDTKLGWSGLATEGVEVYEVPGGHFTIMRPPHVQHLAERLGACLETLSTPPASLKSTGGRWHNDAGAGILTASN